jgi:hypothetical protein
MVDYTALGTAIKTTLAADAWFQVSANVKTMETHKRGFNLQDEKDAQFFAPADLPAIAIVPNSAPKRQSLETTNEIRETVPCQVVAVTRSRDLQAGMTVSQSLVNNIERVLDAQKSSAKNLGIDAFVQTTDTAQEQFKRGEYYYFIATTTAQIELTATF